MEDHEAFVSLGEIYEADRHRQVYPKSNRLFAPCVVLFSFVSLLFCSVLFCLILVCSVLSCLDCSFVLFSWSYRRCQRLAKCHFGATTVFVIVFDAFPGFPLCIEPPFFFFVFEGQRRSWHEICREFTCAVRLLYRAKPVIVVVG